MLSPALQDLVRTLEATRDHTPQSLGLALNRPIGIDDVAPFIRFDSTNYVRNLVHRGRHFELRLLCWRPGQTSSLHAHGPAACAFRVLVGSATETILGARDRKWAPGDVVSEVGPRLVHQVGNTDADALLTLHAYSPELPVDAPSSRTGHEVVIVGGGFSGVAVAYHLLRCGGADLRITIVERGPWIGRGVAYGVDSDVFRLNVPASRMSLDPESREDFVRWAGAEDHPHAFLSRKLYGSYVVDRFRDAIHSSPGKLRIVRGDVHSIEKESVLLVGGVRLPAAAVVVATGLSPRIDRSWLPGDPRVIDAWDECALAALPRSGRLLVVGSGLTALDVLSFLERHRFTGSASIISRRGLLPAPHAPHGNPVRVLSEEELANAPRELRALIRWVRSVIAERGAPWQHGVDALRPHISRLWRGLSPADRTRFVRLVRPYWDVVRHRAPEDAHALVQKWQRDDRLTRIAGTIAKCDGNEHGVDVTLRLAGGRMRTDRFAAIVRCIGPALTRGDADSPVIQRMTEHGLALPDAAGLGIVTDESGRIVDRDGIPSNRLFALGALQRASSWETTAVPDIAVYAARIARLITDTPPRS